METKTTITDHRLYETVVAELPAFILANAPAELDLRERERMEITAFAHLCYSSSSLRFTAGSAWADICISIDRDRTVGFAETTFEDEIGNIWSVSRLTAKIGWYSATDLDAGGAELFAAMVQKLAVFARLIETEFSGPIRQISESAESRAAAAVRIKADASMKAATLIVSELGKGLRVDGTKRAAFEKRQLDNGAYPVAIKDRFFQLIVTDGCYFVTRLGPAAAASEKA